MHSIPPAIQTFLCRAWLGASVGYLAVALLILRPTNWFGLAHCVWAIICIFGTWQLCKAAKKREEEAIEPSLAQRLASVDEARRKGLITDDEYQAKRAKLIEEA